MNEYKIKLGQITNGENSFVFEIRDTFFDAFPLSEVKYARLVAIALINKEAKDLTLTLSIEGKINNLLCDICAEEMSINVKSATTVFIKKTDNIQTSTDEILFVKNNENAIDIKQLLFELIILSLPEKREHPLNNNGESICNKEMLDLIKKYTKKETTLSDPRWEGLKNLKLK